MPLSERSKDFLVKVVGRGIDMYGIPHMVKQLGALRERIDKMYDEPQFEAQRALIAEWQNNPQEVTQIVNGMLGLT